MIENARYRSGKKSAAYSHKSLFLQTSRMTAAMMEAFLTMGSPPDQCRRILSG